MPPPTGDPAPPTDADRADRDRADAGPPHRSLRLLATAAGMPTDPVAWAAAVRGVEWNLPADRGGPRPLKVIREKNAGRVSVWGATLEIGGAARAVVLKVDPVDSPKRWLHSLFRTSKARRQWRGAMELDRAGVPTALPLALFTAKPDPAHPGPRCEVLCLEALPGRSVLHHLNDAHRLDGTQRHPDAPDAVRTHHQIARTLGQHLVRMENAGLVNRDGKPSNLIVTAVNPPAIAVVDTVAIERRRPTPTREVPETDTVRALRDLVLEPKGCGVPPRLSLMMRTLTAYLAHRVSREDRAAWRDRRNRLWNKALLSLRNAGDPTPRDNPLA